MLPKYTYYLVPETLLVAIKCFCDDRSLPDYRRTDQILDFYIGKVRVIRLVKFKEKKGEPKAREKEVYLLVSKDRYEASREVFEGMLNRFENIGDKKEIEFKGEIDICIGPLEKKGRKVYELVDYILSSMDRDYLEDLRLRSSGLRYSISNLIYNYYGWESSLWSRGPRKKRRPIPEVLKGMYNEMTLTKENDPEEH